MTTLCGHSSPLESIGFSLSNTSCPVLWRTVLLFRCFLGACASKPRICLMLVATEHLASDLKRNIECLINQNQNHSRHYYPENRFICQVLTSYSYEFAHSAPNVKPRLTFPAVSFHQFSSCFLVFADACKHSDKDIT